jgi:hypothetical protein
MRFAIGNDGAIGIAERQRNAGQVIIVIAPDIERLGGGRQPHGTGPDLLFRLKRQLFAAQPAIHVHQQDFNTRRRFSARMS